MTKKNDAPDSGTNPPTEAPDAPETPRATQSPTAPPNVTGEDWAALAVIAGHRARMDEARRAKLDATLAKLGPSDTADWLVSIASEPAEPEQPAKRPVPKGHVGTPAMPSSYGTYHPRTRDEWLDTVRRARRGDPEARRAVEYLRDDHTFDPMRLESQREIDTGRARSNARRYTPRKGND